MRIPFLHRAIGRPAQARADEARDAGRWAEAAVAYAQHLEGCPEHFGIWVQLGHARKESGDLEGASYAYARAERLRPADADLFLHVGHLAKLRGDRAAAVAAYQRSITLDPGGADAANELYELDRATLAEAPPPPGGHGTDWLRSLAQEARARHDGRTEAICVQLLLHGMSGDAALWQRLGALLHSLEGAAAAERCAALARSCDESTTGLQGKEHTAP